LSYGFSVEGRSLSRGRLQASKRRLATLYKEPAIGEDEYNRKKLAVEHVLGELVVPEGEEAVEAGARKARALGMLDYSTFRERLAAFLQRRGFSYDVIGPTVERLWQEREEADIASGP
jgi:SOS response regulatory protein OraA/RecX